MTNRAQKGKINKFQAGAKSIQIMCWTILSSVVDPEWFFPDPYPTFQVVSDPYSDPDPVSDPSSIFANILKIKFTLEFPSCKCGRLHIMKRYRLAAACETLSR